MSNRILQRVYRLERADIERATVASTLIATCVDSQQPVAEQWIMDWEADEFGLMKTVMLVQNFEYPAEKVGQ